MMTKVYTAKLYTCECGYETFDSSHATKHKRTISCKDKEMKTEMIEFIKKSDQQHVIVNRTVNYIFKMPNDTLKEDMIEYIKILDPKSVSLEMIPVPEKTNDTDVF